MTQPNVTKFGVRLETKLGVPGAHCNARVMCLIHLHLHMRARVDLPLFRVSEIAGWITLRFATWLKTR